MASFVLMHAHGNCNGTSCKNSKRTDEANYHKVDEALFKRHDYTEDDNRIKLSEATDENNESFEQFIVHLVNGLKRWLEFAKVIIWKSDKVVYAAAICESSCKSLSCLSK